LLAGLLILSLPLAIAQKSKAQLEREKKARHRKIEETNRILSRVEKQKKASLGQLNAINQQIQNREQAIASINDELKGIQRDFTQILGVKASLEIDYQNIRKEYAAMVYAASKAGNLNKVVFLFSAETFNQFTMRLNYLKQYAKARREQVNKMKAIQLDLDTQEKLLAAKRKEKELLLGEELKQSTQLVGLRVKELGVVGELTGKEKELQRELEKQRSAYRKVEKMIAELVRREIRKSMSRTRSESKIDDDVEKIPMTPEVALISKTFTGTKRSMIWPVSSGFIASRFGKHEHPVLKKVYVDNLGVDIQTNENEKVRSVFEGVVGFVASVPGMNGKIVTIRHGNYFTVYSNLGEVNVKTEQKVSAREVIGRVYTDADGVSMVQFQIWKDNQRLDPEEWLAKH